jgi:hypothetical protein
MSGESQSRTSPNPANYYIGAGILEIAPWNGNVVGAYVDVGNCPRFEYEMTEETIPHEGSRSRIREDDAEIVVKDGYNCSFTLDEISIENLRMFLHADLSGKRILYAGQSINRYYALRFSTDNISGMNGKYEFHKAKLTPNGAFSLISKEWSTLGFSGKGLADRAGHATSPLFTYTGDTTTTTTTSTTSTTATD